MNAQPLIRSALREFRKCLMYPHHLEDIRFLLSCNPITTSCTLNPLLLGNDIKANQYIHLDQYYVLRRARSDFLEKIRGNHSMTSQISLSLNERDNLNHNIQDSNNVSVNKQQHVSSLSYENLSQPKISLAKLPPTEIDFLSKLFWIIKRLQGISRDTSSFDVASVPRSTLYTHSSTLCSDENSTNIATRQSSSLPVRDIVRSAGNNGIHTDFFADPVATTSFPFAREFLSGSPHSIINTSDFHTTAATTGVSVSDPISEHTNTCQSLLLPPNGYSLNSPVILTKMTPSSFIRNRLPTSCIVEDNENGVILQVNVVQIESGFQIPTDNDAGMVVRGGLLGGGSAIGSTTPRYMFTYILKKMENSKSSTEVNKFETNKDSVRNTIGRQDKIQNGRMIGDHFPKKKREGVLLVNTYIAVIDCCGDESVTSSKTILMEYRGLMDMESNLTLIREIAPVTNVKNEEHHICSGLINTKSGSDDTTSTTSTSDEDDSNKIVRGEICIPTSSHDGPAAVKGKFYYKLISNPNITCMSEGGSPIPIRDNIQKTDEHKFLQSASPILCIEFPPLALKDSDDGTS